jgi:hypothetical protein
MSWVAGRKTSRSEDIAYCMLGLFDVNMPLLYGEGKKAFMRLQLEIIRKSDDGSIFAWDLGSKRNPDNPQINMGMLTLTFARFKDSRYVERSGKLRGEIGGYPYAMTNRGLRFEADDGEGIFRTTLEPTTRRPELVLQLRCFVRCPLGESGSARQIHVSLEQRLEQGRHWERRVRDTGCRMGRNQRGRFAELLFMLHPGIT